MKIIHCADIHLDSPMNTNFDEATADSLRAGLIKAFKEMADYAVTCGAEAIIIAGDLFDRTRVSAFARREVEAVIKGHPDIVFYYLQGNHDNGAFLMGLKEIPDNLRTFSGEWTVYEQGEKVRIYGVELSRENSADIYGSLETDRDSFNIVVLHGQTENHKVNNRAESINLNGLKNRGIDYLALGHIHSYIEAPLDKRGIYCYPGCLVGRGFDEPGAHGFVVLDIDESTGSLKTERVYSSAPGIYVTRVDVTDLKNDDAIATAVGEVLEADGVKEESLIWVTLSGSLDEEYEPNREYIRQLLLDSYPHLRLEDSIHYETDYRKYEKDISLKGEFIRTVMDDDELTGQERTAIIRMGLKALLGEL